MDATQLATAALTTVSGLCAATMLPAGAVISMGSGGGSFTLDEPASYQLPCPTFVPRHIELATTSGSSTLDTNGNLNSSPEDIEFPCSLLRIYLSNMLCSSRLHSHVLYARHHASHHSPILPRRRCQISFAPQFYQQRISRGISIGGRPWLQKVAALTVAASLTVATASTFRVAEIQYSWGAQNANVLQNEVMGKTDLKVIRIISNTFLWLAQAQTLIRLFPRQREKIIIKWVAFALITLDIIFSCLNSFIYAPNGIIGHNRPRSFVHPVPTLSYLFQLSLELLYAAWVIYYAFMKRRYAFYHPLMKNMCLVAVLAIGSISTPIVFFVLDISKPEFTVWADYVRWVGAAAASVVVWEWVERIEALERETKKDGILGRKYFTRMIC